MPYRIRRFGWLPDPYDHRDLQQSRVSKSLAATARAFLATGGRTHGPNDALMQAKAPSKLPDKVDLSEHFTPIEDQGEIGSCTAHAVVGLIEYLWKRTERSTLDASRLFVYKATRNLLGWTGDTGAYVRAAVKALRLFGACPEDYWPYEQQRFDEEPPPFCYAFAQHYRTLRYYRLPERIRDLRQSLAQGIPFAFGFTCYESIDDVWSDPQDRHAGLIPYPENNEAVVGGHAVVAIGYDQEEKCFLIRNSWGRTWGYRGYGRLPYAYFGKTDGKNATDEDADSVSGKLATDCWCIVKTQYESLKPDELFESTQNQVSRSGERSRGKATGRKAKRGR